MSIRYSIRKKRLNKGWLAGRSSSAGSSDTRNIPIKSRHFSYRSGEPRLPFAVISKIVDGGLLDERGEHAVAALQRGQGPVSSGKRRIACRIGIICAGTVR
jgi:hypothetical protein